jgi:hypothetical protein
MPEQSRPTSKIDSINLNKALAYKGDIGRKREAFCINYIKRKKEILRDILADQQKTVSSQRENITCHEGCTYCCELYLQASIPECEAIVYFLYQHDDVLAVFLANYHEWRRQLKKNGDIHIKCGDAWQATTAPGAGQEAHRDLRAESWRYQLQRLLCPFIRDSACSIYEVRPFTCAGTVSTSPTQNCIPDRPGKPKVYQTKIPALMDNSFYYQSIQGDIFAFMPLLVYGLLVDSYRLLANIPGLEGLAEAALSEPEVSEIIKASHRPV